MQLRPQEAKVEASPNSPASVAFSVALADVPVDIYFVMDHSNSMEDHKNNLVNAAIRIADKVPYSIYIVLYVLKMYLLLIV